MESAQEYKQTQVGCNPMEVKSTQTESRIEEIKIQQLLEHNSLEAGLDKEETLFSLLDVQVSQLDHLSTTKAMQSTVHENMLKLLNKEPAKDCIYDTSSENMHDANDLLKLSKNKPEQKDYIQSKF